MDGSRTDGLIHAAGRAGTGMTAKEPQHLPQAPTPRQVPLAIVSQVVV